MGVIVDGTGLNRTLGVAPGVPGAPIAGTAGQYNECHEGNNDLTSEPYPPCSIG